MFLIEFDHRKPAIHRLQVSGNIPTDVHKLRHDLLLYCTIVHKLWKSRHRGPTIEDIEYGTGSHVRRKGDPDKKKPTCEGGGYKLLFCSGLLVSCPACRHKML
jgi:hypothetical protein